MKLRSPMSVDDRSPAGHRSGRLPDRVGAGSGRHGGRLPGHRSAAEAAGGVEAGGAGAGCRSALPGALPARGRAGRLARPLPRRAGLRGRRDRRAAVDRDALRAGHRPANAARARRGRSSRPGRSSSCSQVGERPRRRPRARARAPRRQARQRARHPGGRRGALLPGRLRAGAQPRATSRSPAAAPTFPGTVDYTAPEQIAARAGRPARRRVLAGLRALRVPGRRAAVQAAAPRRHPVRPRQRPAALRCTQPGPSCPRPSTR